MKRIESISHVINILKKEVKRFKEPIVTQYARKKDPFKVLISCILSLRTRDEVTKGASKRLFSKADTPKKILKLKTKEIERLIYPVGFYKTKAERLKTICQDLLNNYAGEVPNSEEELLKLKGVGRKTMNIVLTYAFNNPKGLAIDVHCHRIPNRLGWVKTKTPEQTEYELRRILPKKYYRAFNDIFVTFGQNICVPISPFCSKCPIRKYCPKIGVSKHR